MRMPAGVGIRGTALFRADSERIAMGEGADTAILLVPFKVRVPDFGGMLRNRNLCVRSL